MKDGTRLGPYEIQAQLGAGGMGEVYLAQDTRLGRRVAIKVLPDEYAGDPERLARFEQEARAAAALNHPNIAVVHDVGEADGTHFMVQEYLEGQTLRDLLAAGPLRLDRLLALGVEVAQALTAAHVAGIVHRDLKPENVFITADGHAKVLDFGLAKLTEASAAVAADATMSPTVLGTVAGQIMGTVGYMAPEQVDGRPVDRRADLFALGCVLFEMAAGERPFAGSSLHETLHMIGHAPTPSLGRRAPALPPDLDIVLDKLLAKAPEDRYQHADDVAVDLRRLIRRVEAGTLAGSSTPPAAARVRLATPLLALATVGALAVAGWALTRESPRAGRVVRASIPVQGLGYTRSGDGRTVMISPDGDTLVALSIVNGQEVLVVRDLDRDDSRLVEVGRAALNDPAFSPDSEWIAFRTARGVSKVSRTGGGLQQLATISINQPVVWAGQSDVLALRGNEALLVPARGGEPRLVATAPGEGYVELQMPSMLPGGTRALMVRSGEPGSLGQRQGGRGDVAQIVALDLESGQFHDLGINGSSPMYVSSGHLVYVADRRIYVVPFDADSLAVEGPAAVVPEPIALDGFGLLMMSVSEDGTLAYLPDTQWARFELAWVDRAGSATPIDFVGQQNLSALSDPRISSDGERIVLASDFDVWSIDLPSETMTLVAAGAGQSFYPDWVGDTTRVVYSAERGGPYEVYSRVADSSAPEELLFSSPNALRTVAWVDAHNEMLVREQTIDEGMNILSVPLTGLDDARKVLTSEHDEVAPHVSPDGRWIVYMTDETGRDEIWVTAFPDAGRRIQVSQEGGREPRWAPDSREVFYWHGHRMYSAQLSFDPELRVSTREVLFERPFVRYRWHAQYDVHPDGQRFIMLAGNQRETNVSLVTNWGSTLTELTDRR